VGKAAVALEGAYVLLNSLLSSLLACLVLGMLWMVEGGGSPSCTEKPDSRMSAGVP